MNTCQVSTILPHLHLLNVFRMFPIPRKQNSTSRWFESSVIFSLKNTVFARIAEPQIESFDCASSNDDWSDGELTYSPGEIKLLSNPFSSQISSQHSFWAPSPFGTAYSAAGSSSPVVHIYSYEE